MRPKPSREWVMAELERLQVRIVAGRRSSNEMRVAKAAQAGLTGGRASAPTGFGAASARGSLSGAVASVQPTYSLLNDIAPRASARPGTT